MKAGFGAVAVVALAAFSLLASAACGPSRTVATEPGTSQSMPSGCGAAGPLESGLDVVVDELATGGPGAEPGSWVKHRYLLVRLPSAGDNNQAIAALAQRLQESGYLLTPSDQQWVRWSGGCGDGDSRVSVEVGLFTDFLRYPERGTMGLPTFGEAFADTSGAFAVVGVATCCS
jgi:hypothetical protein